MGFGLVGYSSHETPRTACQRACLMGTVYQGLTTLTSRRLSDNPPGFPPTATPTQTEAEFRIARRGKGH
jgi:hypothetical protein